MLKRLSIGLGVLAMVVFSMPALAAGQKPFFENNMDRWGADYRVFDVSESGGPSVCHMECKRDGSCKSWTYVRPGIEGAAGRCKLKNRVPHGRASSCCVSGVNMPNGGGLQSHEASYTKPEPSTLSRILEEEGAAKALTIATATDDMEDRMAIIQAATLIAAKRHALEIAEREKPVAVRPPLILAGVR